VPQSRSGCSAEEKNLTPAGNRTRVAQTVTLRDTDVPLSGIHHLSILVTCPQNITNNAISI
jgi:hypothetical protein